MFVNGAKFKLFFIIFFFVALSALTAFFFLRFYPAFKGECLEQGALPSQEMLIKNYLLKSTLPEVLNGFGLVTISNTEEYTHCCRINKKAEGKVYLDRFLNALGGEYFYGVELILPRQGEGSIENPYIHVISSINACGTVIGRQKYSMPVGVSTYRAFVNENKLSKGGGE